MNLRLIKLAAIALAFPVISAAKEKCDTHQNSNVGLRQPTAFSKPLATASGSGAIVKGRN